MHESTVARERRSGWAKDIKLRISPRDLSILYALARCGVLRTKDIVRLFFGSRVTANDRLRKLFCAALICCFAPDLGHDNYYVLSERGLALLRDTTDFDLSHVTLMRVLPKKLEHLIAINEYRIHLSLACNRSDRELICFETDRDLARERHHVMLELVPDAIVTLRDQTHGDVAFFLECDLGSEELNFVVRRKLARYETSARTQTSLYGHQNPLIVFVTQSLRRARNIASAMQSARVAPNLVFALHSDVSESNVLGPAYALPDDLINRSSGDDVRELFSRRLLP